MLHNILYARKSTESEDRQILSIDSQIRELQTLANHRGLVVDEILTETKSAKAPGRPVFGQLMRRVEKGHVRSILCWKMDRLARNHYDTGGILQALADGKIQEVITSDRTYTRDGNDRFMGSFEFGMATKYIDDLRANVRRGNRARFARGWLNHNPPLGYLLDSATKTIVRDPARFDLVRRMFDLVLTGVTRPTEVLRIANKEWGFQTRQTKRRSGGPLQRSTLFKMLGDPFYMGVIRLQTGETFSGAHPPMLQAGEFDRVQEILGRPGRPRPQRHAFAFAGLLKCGRCGASVTAEQHVKKSGLRYVYYRCTRRKTGTLCTEPAVTEPNLVDQLGARFKQIAISERMRRWMVRQAEKGLGNEAHVRERARTTINAALEALNKESENLVTLRLRDLLADDAFLARKREIDERRQTLETLFAQPTREPGEVTRLTIAAINFAARIPKVFAHGTRVQQRMILETVGLNYSLRGRNVAFSFRNPYRILADAAEKSTWWTCPDDIRTWLQDTTEHFSLPNLKQALGSPSTPLDAYYSNES